MASFFLSFLFCTVLSSAQPVGANPLLTLEKQLFQREKLTPGLVKGAEAHFLFANLASPTQTLRSLVYFHGFSASPPEVSPLVENLGRTLKANAFFPRFSGHGFEGSDGLRGVTAQHWNAETSASLDVARKLGHKVVVVATSTGATLALLEALRNPAGIEALVLISPNFGLKAKGETLLLLPYGLGWLLGRMLLGSYRSFVPLNPRMALYWTPRYPFTAVTEVVRVIEEVKDGKLENLRVPVLFAYSEKDNVIDLAALKATFTRLGSPKKALVEIKNAENDHVLAGDILSPSGTAELEKAITAFLDQSQ